MILEIAIASAVKVKLGMETVIRIVIYLYVILMMEIVISVLAMRICLGIKCVMLNAIQRFVSMIEGTAK